jgi:hypothetical protein
MSRRKNESEIVQAIAWLMSHPSYVSAGYALAEYASKSVFVHNELGFLLGRIQNLAEMPPLAVSRAAFAQLAVTPPQEHQALALHVFNGNPWYEIGASCKAVTQHELHESYERWRCWGQRNWPLLALVFSQA